MATYEKSEACALQCEGSPIPLDREGYLLNLDDWNPGVARLLAARDGVELTPAHWEVINLMRDFHRQRGLSPIMRILVKLMEKHFGPEKGNSLYLLKLFPGSPAKLASRIAGLPRPTNCL